MVKKYSKRQLVAGFFHFFGAIYPRYQDAILMAALSLFTLAIGSWMWLSIFRGCML